VNNPTSVSTANETGATKRPQRSHDLKTDSAREGQIFDSSSSFQVKEYRTVRTDNNNHDDRRLHVRRSAAKAPTSGRRRFHDPIWRFQIKCAEQFCSISIHSIAARSHPGPLQPSARYPQCLVSQYFHSSLHANVIHVVRTFSSISVETIETKQWKVQLPAERIRQTTSSVLMDWFPEWTRCSACILCRSFTIDHSHGRMTW